MGLNQDYLKRLLENECVDATYTANYPTVLKKAIGSEIFDCEGRRLIDLCAGFGVHAFGHNPTVLKKVIEEQLSSSEIVHGMGDVYPSDAKVEFIEDFLKTLPNRLNKAAVSLTGSQAVEMSLKTAILKTKKFGFIAVKGSYHGLDMGVLPLTYRRDFKQPFAGHLCLDQIEFVASPFSQDALIEAKRKLEENGVGLAGLILEPIIGRGGVRDISLSSLQMARQFCSSHEALLIYDEIFCGLGRSGQWSYSSQVEPDLSCFGKPLGLGFPVSVCVGTDEAFSGWEDKPEAIHTGTFYGHPFSLRCASAFLREWQEGGWSETVRDVSERFTNILDKKLSKSPSIKEIRSYGMMFAIEFSGDGKAASLLDGLTEAGVIALPSGALGEVLTLSPAYNISEQLFVEAIDIIENTIKI